MQFHEWLFSPYTLERIVNDCTRDWVIFDTGYQNLLNITKQACNPAPIYRERCDYQTCIGWKVPATVFIKAYLAYQAFIVKQREEWERQWDILKLFEVIRYAFQQNWNAHHHPRSRYHSFDKKSFALGLAIKYAFLIDTPNFTWGYQDDEANSRHPIIVYFQLGEDPKWQVSFHSSNFNAELPIPEFTGNWNGIHHVKFPYTRRDILKMCQIGKFPQVSTPDTNPPSILNKQAIQTYLEKEIAKKQENQKQMKNESQMLEIISAPERILTSIPISFPTLDKWFRRVIQNV